MTAPLVFSSPSYTDNRRRLEAPLRGQEQVLLAQALPALEHGALELDLSDLLQLAAAGLGALAPLHSYAFECGHRLKLVNPQPRVWELLRMTGLDEVFTLQMCA